MHSFLDYIIIQYLLIVRTKLVFESDTNSIGQVGKITCEEGFQFVGNTLS